MIQITWHFYTGLSLSFILLLNLSLISSFLPGALLFIRRVFRRFQIISQHAFRYNPLSDVTSMGFIALWEWHAQKDKSVATTGTAMSLQKSINKCMIWAGSQQKANDITRMMSIFTIFLFWASRFSIAMRERLPGALFLHSFRQINAYNVPMNTRGTT